MGIAPILVMMGLFAPPILSVEPRPIAMQFVVSLTLPLAPTAMGAARVGVTIITMPSATPVAGIVY